MFYSLSLIEFLSIKFNKIALESMKNFSDNSTIYYIVILSKVLISISLKSLNNNSYISSLNKFKYSLFLFVKQGSSKSSIS